MFKHKYFLITLIIALFIHKVYSQGIDQLSACILFNNGDSSNKVNNKKIKVNQGTFVDDRFGNSRSAYFLHGNYLSYINLGNGPELKPNHGTISLWIKIDHPMPNGIGVEINPVITTRSNKEPDFNEAYTIVYDLNTKQLAANTTFSKEKQVSVYSAEQFSLRKWHHIALTYDEKYMCLYIDGILQGRMTKGFDSKFLSGDSVLIGNLFSKKNKRFFNGSVDDIYIYSKVLNPTEIYELYNSPNPNKSDIIIKWIIIICLVFFVIIILVLSIKFRINSLVKKEEEKRQVKLHALEQEIRMLKAQMNPHFMFNSLNTILQFIIIKENEKAELYLTKFSKLIRKLLESNTQNNISLKDELEIINKYLEIESLRFDTKVEAIIELSNEVNEDEINVPQMLIQPFIENAIWHGLILKEGEKRLVIKFEKINEKALLCIIDDNGVGRKQTINSNIVEKGKPLAISFVKQRLELMSKMYLNDYSVEIIDKVDEKNNSIGTCVELKLPIID